MSFTIRAEQPGDADAIEAVHRAGFPTLGEARLVAALRASGRLSVSLVAEVQGRIVGHVAFSPVTAGDSEAPGAGLGPIAVLPEFRRRGLGARLVREGLAACEASGFGFAVVLGDPDYYARLGFEPARRWSLSDEYDGGDAFRAIELRPGGLPAGAGLVRYATEFSDLGDG